MIFAGDLRLMSDQDSLNTIVSLLRDRFDSVDHSLTEVKATVADLQTRPSITPEQHAWIAEGAKRDADAAEQRAQIETARRLNRRGYVLSGVGLSFTALSALMNYGHALAESLTRLLGGH